MVYSSVVILANFIVAFIVAGDIHAYLASISLFLLLEGGVCLAIGGAAVMYSPMSSKILEVLFKSEPWNAKRQKEVEKKAGLWIVSGVIIVVVALFISAF